MATLTPTITLTSTDLFPDESLSLSLTDSLEVLGPVTTKRVVVDSASSNVTADNLILKASAMTKSYVLLFNTSTATSGEIITLGFDSDTDAGLDRVNLELAPGEFAFFPYHASVDVHADASSGTTVLEVRAYQAAL